MKTAVGIIILLALAFGVSTVAFIDQIERQAQDAGNYKAAKAKLEKYEKDRNHGQEPCKHE